MDSSRKDLRYFMAMCEGEDGMKLGKWLFERTVCRISKWGYGDGLRLWTSSFLSRLICMRCIHPYATMFISCQHSVCDNKCEVYILRWERES